MPRQARLVFPHVALHVRQRGHDGAACFRRDDDYLVRLACVRELLRGTGCRLHAYCLYFNRRYERSGTLWEGRFSSCLVDSATYVLACYRYIERNPVKAGMVPAASEYSWSSYAGNAGYVHNTLLTPHAEYVALGVELQSRLAADRQLVAQPDGPAFLAAVPPGPAPTPSVDQPDLLDGLGLRPRTS